MPDPASLDEDIRTLTREHGRLEAEIARLREEQQRTAEEKAPGGNGNQLQPSDLEGKREPAQQQTNKDEEQPKPPVRRRVHGWTRRHPLGALIGLVLLIALLVGGYFLWQYLHSYVSTDDANIDTDIAPVAARIAGMVIGVYTENNRSVVEGQTLVDLDPRDYQTSLAQAQAGLAQAQAALREQAPNVPITETAQATNVATAAQDVTNAAAALQAAQNTFTSSTSALAQAQAEEANAAAEETRYRALVNKDEVSREQYDAKATALRSQQATVAARRADSDAANRAIIEHQATLAQAQARLHEAQANQPRQVAVQHATTATRQANVQAAEAQLKQAGLNLSYTRILAPVSGIVGNKSVDVGQQVTPGEQLFSITPVSDFWVTANFKETEITQMRPGQSASIHVDALDLDFAGYVENMPGGTGAIYSLLPPENATGNFVKVVQRLPVRIHLKPNQQGYDRLRPGMSVEAKVWLR